MLTRTTFDRKGNEIEKVLKRGNVSYDTCKSLAQKDWDDGGAEPPKTPTAPKGDAKPPKAARPLKWKKDNEAIARNAGRFAVVGGNRTEGYEAEYTRSEWVGKAITTDDDDKLARVKLGNFSTKKAAKEAWKRSTPPSRHMTSWCRNKLTLTER